MIWVNAVNKLSCQPNANIVDWLTKPYILSHALRRICQVFSVKILAQHFCDAPSDDKIKLALQEDNSLVREVILEGDGLPLTYGRVTIPQQAYRNHLDLFGNLNDQPIGENILYNNPEVTRSAFEYGFCEQRKQWGRRSVFYIQLDPILVTEFFFPTIPLFPGD